MALRLYNTFSKREEDFVPADPKRVTMYTCGPTVYGRPHVGNYASFLMADLLRRWLEVGHGYTVEQVKNITDVGHLLHDADQGDDKVQKEAEKEKVHPLMIAKKYEEMYLADEKELRFLEPKSRPHASEYVPQMLTIIKSLLKKNHAYETDDGIYFSVTSFPSYGKLSGNTLDNINAGARIEVDEKKKHPADFALWKKCVGGNGKHILRWSFDTGEISNTEGEDALSGFPGWHIECSAMASSLLGEQIDLHTGGEDNIFPHHECEIAQSECAFGKIFVKTWLHRRRIDITTTLRQAQGESLEVTQKMSKSLGNVLDLPSIVDKGYSPLDLRYFLLSVHYRTNLKFEWKGLDDAKIARRSISAWIARGGVGEMAAKNDSTVEVSPGHVQSFEEAFNNFMDSDLNVSGAIATIFACMHKMNAAGLPSESTRQALAQFIAKIQHTFGCFEQEEVAISADLEAIISLRQQARDAKNFAEADRLRLEIESRGFIVKDTKEGQKISKK